jgi:hypothetical protein
MPAGVSAYTALANVTLGSTASSVTFSSISQAYRDLVLVITASSVGNTLALQLNNDTGSNYSWVTMGGNGSTATSTSQSGNSYATLNRQAIMDGVTASFVINIMDYSATDKHKTILNRADKAASGTDASANRWASTSAATSVTVIAPSWSLSSGSTFALYGVSA